jgi:hypothetical protein
MILLNMHEYLLYSPIFIFLVWLYILWSNIKSLQNIKKISGKSYFYIFTAFPFLNVTGRSEKKELDQAISNHKKQSKKFFRLWM